MNTYNENLNSTVSSLLSELELEQKKLQAHKEAATFTHDYANEAIITALEKTSRISSILLFKQTLAEKMAGCNTVSSALLSSANEANAITKIAVTNSAVTASAIQVAANAVIRLSSDIGSIYSIVSSADAGSEIYNQAATAQKLINDTASIVEITSRFAMEASLLSSSIASASILSEAKNTDQHACDLATILTGEYQAVKDQQQAILPELNNAFDNEKKSKQELEKITVEYPAVREAYYTTIKNLNLNLQVHPSGKKEAAGYTVSFDEYATPFYDTEKEYDPTESYFIMLVKDSKKITFSMLNAIECADTLRQFIQLKKSTNSNKTEYKKEIAVSDLLDSDGESPKEEVPYVIFVMIRLKDEYKKMLNNFDDLLTAPSLTFTINTPTNYTVANNTLTEKKQQELSELTAEVLKAQLKVDQLQGKVTVLTDKFSVSQTELDVADANKTQALNNKNLADQLVTDAWNLKNEALRALNASKEATIKSDETAEHINTVINKLVYTAQIVNKLSNAVIRKKALNPLISDELVSLVTTTDKDANNAVALTLVALNPAFMALTTNKETEAITALEHMQADKLYNLLVVDKDPAKLSLLNPATILDNSYIKSKEEYDTAKTVAEKITTELSLATEELNAAQQTLMSLQSGLAAAYAASLAS